MNISKTMAVKKKVILPLGLWEATKSANQIPATLIIKIIGFMIKEIPIR